jgi:hypothetical protein
MQEWADYIRAAVLGQEWVRDLLGHTWTLYLLGQAWMLYLGAGITVLLLLSWLVARERPRRDSCTWQLDKKRRSKSLKKFTCTRCGADAYSLTSRHPVGCKRELMPKPL